MRHCTTTPAPPLDPRGILQAPASGPQFQKGMVHLHSKLETRVPFVLHLSVLQAPPRSICEDVYSRLIIPIRWKVPEDRIHV